MQSPRATGEPTGRPEKKKTRGKNKMPWRKNRGENLHPNAFFLRKEKPGKGKEASSLSEKRRNLREEGGKNLGSMRAKKNFVLILQKKNEKKTSYHNKPGGNS